MPGYHAGESVQLSHQNLFGTSVNPRLAGEDAGPSSGMGTLNETESRLSRVNGLPNCMCSDLRDDKGDARISDQSQHRLFAGYTARR